MIPKQKRISQFFTSTAGFLQFIIPFLCKKTDTECRGINDGIRKFPVRCIIIHTASGSGYCILFFPDLNFLSDGIIILCRKTFLQNNFIACFRESPVIQRDFIYFFAV